jgi:hypothetical protein
VIDFRYHLVSIIAVFLALAVGLLVGSTYISGYAEEALKGAEHLLTQDNAALRTTNKALGQQNKADQAFAQAGAKQLLAPGGAGLLAGQKVVLVEAPGASGQMSTGLILALKQAGAVVTGEVLLRAPFFDGSGRTESSLTQLAQQLATQTGVTLPASPIYPAVAGQQQAAAVIAASVVTKTGTGLAGSANQAILSGFGPDGFLQVNNLIQPAASTLSPATLAIVLTPAGTAPDQIMSQALVAVAAQLNSASHGTVMAGSVNAVDPGSAISLEASLGSVSNLVSTVDNADTESGQISVAQALRLLLNGASPAAYGIEPGTAPSPAPTPVATPSSGASSPAVKGKSP